MVEEFTVSFGGQTEEVRIECKPCSKDGLKYICTLPDGEAFRMRVNEHGVWVAKNPECSVDAQLIAAIGERYKALHT